MIKPRFSSAMKIASFVAAILVVAIHANSLGSIAEPERWNVIWHYILCGCLNEWAVPFFFVVSGFWFVLGRYVKDNLPFWMYIKVKIRSLVYPYVIWTLIASLMMLPLNMFSNYHAHHAILKRTVFDVNGIWDFINMTFGLTTSAPRALGPLWYVRALVMIFICAPLWKRLSRRSSAWIFVVAWAVVQIVDPYMIIRCIAFKLGKASWFFLGIAIAVYIPKDWISYRSDENPRNCSVLPCWLSLSFWVYCSHEIITNYLKAFSHFFFGKSNVAAAITTPSSLVLALIISISVGMLVKRKYPRLFDIMNGGR